MTVKGTCRDCMSGRKMKVQDNSDPRELARKMLERGLGDVKQ